MKIIYNKNGSYHLPFLFFICILTLSQFALLLWVNSWKNYTKHQLTLDTCIVTYINNLKNLGKKISLNIKMMNATRALMIPSSSTPVTFKIAQETLRLLNILELSYLSKWKFEITAISFKRCGHTSDIPIIINSTPWTKPLADALGPKPIQWKQNNNIFFQLTIIRKKIKSSALIPFPKEEDIEKKTNWVPSWASSY